jgi:cobalt-zinc-cadmium efflux system membrane fusion protein
MKLRYIKLIFVLLVLTSCGSKENETVPAAKSATDNNNVVMLTDVQIKTAGIQTGKPTIENMSSTIKVNGLVDVPPQNMVSVSFPFGGYLKSTHLLPGMKVRKGESIAVMQEQSLIQMQQEYLVSKSKVSYLQKEYERQKTLNATKTSSDKVFEQISNEYQMERVIVNSLKEKLLMAGINPASLTENKISGSVSIHSPINGYVAAVKVNIGKYVNPADVLFELINPEDIHLAFKVFEKDLPYLKEGQKVKAHLVNNTTKIYNAEIILISKNLDENRSALVHCHFQNSNHDLLPGMFLNAEIETTNGAAVTVPDDGIVRFEDKHYIFVQRSTTRFELMEVKPGNSMNGKTEIASGITNFAEQTIVTKNAYTLLMKLKNTAEE